MGVINSIRTLHDSQLEVKELIGKSAGGRYTVHLVEDARAFVEKCTALEDVLNKLLLNEESINTAELPNVKQMLDGFESELAEIKRTAANVLAINDQNKQLRDQLASAEIEADTLEQQNRELTSQTTRYWFMTGALVLLVGMILGIWLPRIRWQRRSRYDRF